MAKADYAAGTVVRFLIDESNLTGYSQAVLEVEDSGLAKSRRYDFADDLITQVDDPDSAIESAHHFLYDGLGSTRSLTTELGDVAAAYNYTPFGSPLGFTLNADQPHLFAGEWFDASLGYSYNRARYYDTTTGRFTGFDPVEDEGNRLHRYVYCGGDALDLIDPSGQIADAAAIGMGRAFNVAPLLDFLMSAAIASLLAGIAGTSAIGLISRAQSVSTGALVHAQLIDWLSSGEAALMSMASLLTQYPEAVARALNDAMDRVVAAGRWTLRQLSKLPFFPIVKSFGKDVYDFNVFALGVNPKWHVLTYDPDKRRSNTRRRWVRWNVLGPLPSPPGQEVDEFPFAHTWEGGPPAAMGRLVPWLQNRAHGGAFGAFCLWTLRMKKTKRFIVVPIPL